MQMKEHLINKRPDNKYSIITHRIILIVLIIIILYEYTIDTQMEKMNFIYLDKINLYFNILYYFLCVIYDINKKDTKKSFQIFFHFCFSLSSSLPLIYLILGIIHLGEKDFSTNKTLLSIGILLSPIIFNILETLIIKRYKPGYINPIFLIIFITLYYCCMHFLVKIGIGKDDIYMKYSLEIKYLVSIYVSTIVGTFLGWWIYKIVTRSKIKKIDLNNTRDSSELSEE